MDRHKQFIFEWGGVNDNVAMVANAISNEINDISNNNSNVQMSNELKLPYLEGEFIFDFSKVLENPTETFGIDSLKVTYTLYFFKSLEQYNNYIDKHVMTCEAYLDDNEINIVGGIVDGYFNDMITQEIYHELDHIFEYVKGSQYREDLYETILDTINNHNDEIIRNAAFLLYYSFVHEQNAFVHQFYGYITSEKLKPDIEQFEYYLMSFSEYRSLSIHERTYRNLLKSQEEKKKLIIWLETLGYNFNTFSKRCNYSKSRLRRKLYKAFRRYCIENRDKFYKTEMLRNRMDAILLSEYKQLYKDIDYKEEKYAQRIF